MEESSPREDPRKYTKRQLAEKLGKGLRQTNPSILNNPNYQETNPNIPKENKIADAQKPAEASTTRRRDLLAIAAGALTSAIGIRLGWPALSKRLEEEAKDRERIAAEANKNQK